MKPSKKSIKRACLYLGILAVTASLTLLISGFRARQIVKRFIEISQSKMIEAGIDSRAIHKYNHYDHMYLRLANKEDRLAGPLLWQFIWHCSEREEFLVDVPVLWPSEATLEPHSLVTEYS